MRSARSSKTASRCRCSSLALRCNSRIAYSDASRPLIPSQAGHPFRRMSAIRRRQHRHLMPLGHKRSHQRPPEVPDIPSRIYRQKDLQSRLSALITLHSALSSPLSTEAPQRRRFSPSNQCRANAQGLCRSDKPLVQRPNPRPMVGRNGKMQGIACPEPRNVLIGKTGRHTKVRDGHGQHMK